MKDVNNTSYYLFFGRDDWNRSQTEEGAQKWEYDDRSQSIQLQAENFRFAPSDQELIPLDPTQRRDSDRDAFGHVYWIDGTGTAIRAKWAKASQSEVIFPTAQAPCPVSSAHPFQPVAPPPNPSPEPLAGLAMLTGGYLVVGSPTTGSLLVFDLYALDGVALRIPLPLTATGERTQPFDLAALPDGGLLVLDRLHQLIWRLDRSLRPLPRRSPIATLPEIFQPASGRPDRHFTPAISTAIALTGATDPIAIAPLPDGSFWFLDERVGNASAIGYYNPPNPPQFVILETANLVDSGADDLDLTEINAYDLAYVGDTGQTGTIWLVDRLGKQAYALRVITRNPLVLRIERQYYPVRSLGETSLVVDAEDVYYRQIGDRWLPLRALPQQRYEPEASLLLQSLRDRLLDGREPDCVWHRICLDACLPKETTVQIEARATDHPRDLEGLPWTLRHLQPTPYRRPSSEMPDAALWSYPTGSSDSFATWETLLQQVRGRYLQIRLTIRGNGRSTPKIRALRAYYPRFSYAKEYLPDIYQQDPVSFDFLERFFANPEGILTLVEGAIAQIQILFDIRTVPRDALEWLASWIGLAFDPAWSELQRRILIAHAPYFFQRRGTVLGLRQGILLILHPELGSRIFSDDSENLCPTVRIIEQYLTRRLTALALGDPTATLALTGDAESDARDRAHRFTVMLPATLDPDTERLIARWIDLEKPDHTVFTLKTYWALFRVGEVRLGLDTLLGEGGRIEPFRLGRSALAEAALGEIFPYTLTDRTVITHL
jgi:phage tail-like protein